nr:hypothetical protein CFP56_71878 [Quercus suber]
MSNHLDPQAASTVLSPHVDEWEYEYDDEKTEDFYFTLDLTTHVPDALASKEKSANGKPMPTLPIVDDLDEGDELDDEDRDDRLPGFDAARASEHRKLEDEPSNLQFLDLQSDAPLIKFGKAVYRGQWSTDLGTQFYVSRPHVVEEPLKPGNIADVIGISRARLLGRPLRPTHVPRENLIKPEHKTQALFLERLSRIKMARGELDPVPATYGMIKYNNPPEGWEMTRQQALLIDEQKAQERRKRVLEASTPKPRKRRRRKYSEIGLHTKASGEARTERATRSTPARVGPGPSQRIRAALRLQAVPEEQDKEHDDIDDHR